MIEKVLMESGNYSGFRYLTQSEVPCSVAGIHIDATDYANRFVDTDHTRVKYF
jgi:hypothetical protein